jgi:hypothetical protein
MVDGALLVKWTNKHLIGQPMDAPLSSGESDHPISGRREPTEPDNAVTIGRRVFSEHREWIDDPSGWPLGVQRIAPLEPPLVVLAAPAARVDGTPTVLHVTH